MSGNYAVFALERQEVEYAVELAAKEGWNPGLSDAAAFHAADPMGFLAARDGAEIAGTISAVVYGGSYAFLGLFIVQKPLRGRGIGRMLWEAALHRAGKIPTGLDAVTAMAGEYEKHGFVAAYHSVRHLLKSAKSTDKPGLSPLGRVRFAKIDAFDRAHFPGPRTLFLDAWVRSSGAHGFAALADGAVEGYGLIRPCRSGWKIGPLFAERPATAAALLSSLLSSVPPGEDVFLDVPLAGPEAVALAKDFAGVPVFETVRMYRNGPPATGPAGIYGVTSFELG